MKKKGFYQYLKGYLGDNSWEGDLAYDAVNDKGFPRTNNYNKIISYLHDNRACFEAIEAFENIYSEWKRI